MNFLSPTIFPDNTEVNGKMKMKCLNVNGDNITEIITGPKIIYRDGERSFLKSISIDGYRVTISYIDDLFNGATVEAVLSQNGINVMYIKLYPNGNINISGEAYTSVDKSWKTISFDIDPDIQDGYIRRQKPQSGGSQGLNDSNFVSFDFVLPSPSKHALYSSFISDMKYLSKNTEAVKPIDDSVEARRSAPWTESVKARDQMTQALSAEIQRLNYRLDEIENKLRKFGID